VDHPRWLLVRIARTHTEEIVITTPAHSQLSYQSIPVMFAADAETGVDLVCPCEFLRVF
jgi:hypothetical protein